MGIIFESALSSSIATLTVTDTLSVTSQAIIASNVLNTSSILLRVGAAANLGTVDTQNLNIVTNNTTRWIVTTSGNFIANSDLSVDIGASSTNRPRIAYVGGLQVVSNINLSSTNLGIATSRPTIISGFSTAPGVTGIGSAMRIRIAGTGLATNVGVVGFGTMFNNPPIVIANNETISQILRPTASATSVTLNGTMVIGNDISIIAIGT